MLHPPLRLALTLGMTIAAGLAGCGANHSAVATAAAQQALHEKFRGPVEQLEWQSSSRGLVASFQWKSIPVRSWITPEGKVLETELKLEDEDIPSALRDSFKRNYS